MKHYIMGKVVGTILPRHDFWSSITEAGNGVIEKLKGVAPIGIALVVIGLGFMFMYSNKSREAAKSALPYIVGGALLIFGAVAFATWLSGVAKF
ncbi:TrbC/VirB2 family protein [Vagococcus fluvialis]|uniref:TrbC/VirB2 family protein n=1 Tax=Vagococcus fluvialis TaxID=2738 RepID=UPI0028F6E12E|nr:TrbC/VirB2 family protein [Vagococcus fluvialis]WNF91530.1 TrbC/VirB2 family protein [Vagococcus fluvialis]